MPFPVSERRHGALGSEACPRACGVSSAVLSIVGATFTQGPFLWNPAKLKSQRAAYRGESFPAVDTTYS